MPAPFGVLRRGFTIYTPTVTLRIPQGTIVYFHSSEPTIRFEGFPEIRLFRVSGRWFADLWGSIHIVLFDADRPPYPLSYFR